MLEKNLRDFITVIEATVCSAEYDIGKDALSMGALRVGGRNRCETVYINKARYQLIEVRDDTERGENVAREQIKTREIEFVGGWPHIQKGDLIKAYILAAHCSDSERTPPIYQARPLRECEQVIRIEKLSNHARRPQAVYGVLPDNKKVHVLSK